MTCATPTMTMMKLVTSSSVAVSLGSRGPKRMTPSGDCAGADHDHEAEHEQRVGEQRADDRGLRDDDLAGAQGEDDHEELGQVAQRRLQHAGGGGAEALAHLLGGQRDEVGQARQRHRGEREGEQPAQSA